DATAKLIEKQKNSEALDRATRGYKSANQYETNITEELARLKEQSDKSPDSPRLIAEIERGLAALRVLKTQLEGPIKQLEAVVARENDPTLAAREVQVQTLAARISLLLSRGDVDEAINAYDQIMTLLPDDTETKARRDKLKAEWVPKNEAHAKAREYLLKTWPAVATIADFKDSLPQIGAAVDECIKNNDRYTLRKLLTIFSD